MRKNNYLNKINKFTIILQMCKIINTNLMHNLYYMKQLLSHYEDKYNFNVELKGYSE